MTDLRKAAQQALEALEEIADEVFSPYDNKLGDAILALRAALAQQDESDAYGYASRLAVAIWEKHYKDTAPQWKPLDYLIGVLTQIDNMTSGLTRQAQQDEPVQEPAYKVKVAGRWHDTEPLAPAFSLPDGEHLLYTAPPQRLPLTEEEIDGLVIQHAGYGRDNFYAVARAVERAHGIKE